MPHVITLFKRTEAEIGLYAIFYSFQLTGPTANASGDCIIEESSPPRKTRRIEFLGDSITSGYGNNGNYSETQFNWKLEDSYLYDILPFNLIFLYPLTGPNYYPSAYGNQVALALNAELHQESYSGIGLVRRVCL